MEVFFWSVPSSGRFILSLGKDYRKLISKLLSYFNTQSESGEERNTFTELSSPLAPHASVITNVFKTVISIRYKLK
jgi:hypothetical protein